MFEKSRTQGTFYTRIPPAKLEIGIVFITKETIVYMWYNRTNTRFTQQVYLYIFFFIGIPVPAFYNIE
jgi:hypothetical protein